VLFLGYGEGPLSPVPILLTGLCAPVLIAVPRKACRWSDASSAFCRSSALSCSSLSSLLLRFILKLYFALLRKQQHNKTRVRKPRKESPPKIPTTTAVVCGLLEFVGIAVADEVRIIQEEDALLELVLAVILVAAGIGMEDTGVSVTVLPGER
jgi:hypothetical protein